MSKKQFVVIGLGRFGSSVAKTLYKLGNDVLAVDSDEKSVQDIAEYVTHAAQVNITDEEDLKALGISNFDVAVIGIGSNVQDSFMTTLLVKECGIKHVIVKANTELHAKILYKIGADKVVFPEVDTGIKVAYDLSGSNILDYIQLSSDYSIVEIAALKYWHNKTLGELDIRSKYGINIIAVKRKDNIEVSPIADFIIESGDVIVALGNEEKIKKIKGDL